MISSIRSIFFYICWYVHTCRTLGSGLHCTECVPKGTQGHSWQKNNNKIFFTHVKIKQQSTYIFWYYIHPRRMILFQIRFSSISLFLLVSFSIPSHVLAVHLAVEHWKDGIKHVTCKKLNKVHLELSVKAPPVGGLVWSFVVTFDVWLLREFLLDCGLHSGQSDNFRQSPTHFFLFLVNMILSNHIHLPIQMRRVPANGRRCFYPFAKICCRSQCLPLCLGCN